MSNPYTLPGRRPVLSGRRPSTVVVWCIRHRRRRLANAIGPDSGCHECSGQVCRYCGSLRRFTRAAGKPEPPAGVCGAETCMARAEHDQAAIRRTRLRTA